MARIFVTGLLFFLLTACSGCSNLINSMSNQYGTGPSAPTGSKDGPSAQDLTIEETASYVDDFLSLQINDTDSGLDIHFQARINEPDVIISSKNPCITISGDTEVDYEKGAVNWNAYLVLQAVNCAPADGDAGLMNGLFDLHLKGPLGSVGTYHLNGVFTHTTGGVIKGPIETDITYSVADCILKWDCWSGEANGYAMADLREHLSL